MTCDCLRPPLPLASVVLKAFVSGLMCMGAMVRLANAQSAWPSRPIHIIGPYAPGGITDSVARLSAP